MLRSIRQSVGFLWLLALLVTVLWASPEFASANSSDRFRREVESLLGATVQTKQGVAQIRQKRDESGRVRRLFVSGRGFSELQMDENGDGTVDFLEVSKANKTITASQPYRGRFLRLVVSEKTSSGRIEATYILDPSGRRYSLLKSRFFTPDAVLNVDGEAPQSFEATAEIVPASMEASVAAASSSVPEADKATVDLPDDENWRSYQAETWGPDLSCVSDETAIGRLAAFQRNWWKALKYDFDGNTEKLNERLSTAKIFDESCRKSGQETNFKALSSALSEVMMSSSKGETLPSTATRGRYLRCLELSGLGQVAAKIEMHFLQSLDGGNGVQRPIQCDFRPGQAGLSKPAFMHPDTKHIKVQLAAADQGKTKTALGSPVDYKNMLFHELIHVAGISSEEMTHAAQACCGEQTENRPAACAKLDNLVLEERRFLELETFLARSGLMDPLYSDLYNKFDDPYTNDLYRKFVLGLDVYKKGSLFERGLLSNEEFAKCVRAESEVACREKWTRHIADYTAEFFSKECRKHVPANKRRECVALGKSTAFQNQMATAVANSLIRISADPVEPGAPALCGSARTTPETWPTRYAKGILAIFGVEAVVADGSVDCEGSTGIQPSEPQAPVAPNPASSATGEVAPPPRVVATPGSNGGLGGDVSMPSSPGPRLITTPGQTVRDNAAGGNSAAGGDSGVESPSTRPRNPNRSPLPVSEVTTPGGARSVVDRTYRRATDVAGLTTRGLRDLRNSILPRAVASERERRARVEQGGDAEFLAFRPKREEAKSMKIENPFANGNSLILASAGPAVAGSGSSSVQGLGVAPGGDASRAVPSAFASRADQQAASLAGIQAGNQMDKQKLNSGAAAESASGKRGGAGASGSGSSGALAGGGSGDKASSADGTAKSPRAPANVDIETLLRMKYRDLESRLNEISVQQTLIDRRIQVIRANGSIVGAKRAVQSCYKYAGQDKPLKTPCE